MYNVRGIYIAPEAGAKMRCLCHIQASPGGLEGDRYKNGTGAWSKTREQEAVRDLTLISEEAIALANQGRDELFTPADTRRNIIVTVGVQQLNDLLGREFSIGRVQVFGAELCHPCKRPSVLSGKPGFAESFKDRGGLRVRVLNEGLIVFGDVISW